MHEGNSFTGSESAKLLETTFQLKRSGLSHTSVSVSVDFSPCPHDPALHHDQTHLKSIPVYNQDGHFFTPAFILEIDKPKYSQNSPIYKEMFVKKVEEADEESTEMYLPRPSKTNSFCCVCKTFFDDYLTHVNLPLHRTFMEKSQFYSEIHDLCGKFKHMIDENVPKQAKTKSSKTKTVKKEPKPKRQKKTQMDSTSTRVHENSLVCAQAN